MTAYDDVLGWIGGRPWWQQRLLALIASGERVEQGQFEAIARSLIEESPTEPSAGWLASVAPPKADIEEPVRIAAVTGVANVNRLAEGQELTFAPAGLTVVYGNNGSGKSGYARILQSMVRARHRADILSDVFAETPGLQSGRVSFLIGEAPHEAQLGEAAHPALSRVALYDERGGDTYLNTEAEISYRPSAVQLLDDLSTVTAGVRRIVERWKNEASVAGPLPDVSADGPAAAFLAALHPDSSDDAIAAAVSCPPDVELALARKVDEVARLRAVDPSVERQRLRRSAAALETIATHLTALNAALGDDARDRLGALREAALTARSAAEVASALKFQNEPLAGIGSTEWKSLWETAERYALAAYPDHDFPHTGKDAVCVLCQQSLGSGGAARLERFRDFVADTTARDAELARAALHRVMNQIDSCQIETPAIAVAKATVENEFPDLLLQVQSLQDDLSARKAAMLSDTPLASVQVSELSAALSARVSALREKASSTDDAEFAQGLAQAQVEELLLRDQIAMRDGRAQIEAERERLDRSRLLGEAFSQTNTRSITDKVGDLTRKYVTEEARDRFTRETQMLGLEQVTFKATKSRQGAGLLHKADFLNARAGTRLGDVLSEGEQTALGLAGFLTEVHFDSSKSAIIFDDPVSSLDHMRRESVANRIVDLAGERQVIVFTHDIAFTMLLHKTASVEDIPFATRGIERKRKVGPGFTTLKHPWTAQDAAQRVDTLRQEVAALRREESGMSEQEYQRSTEEVAGHMSQTWERIISQVLAEPLVDYQKLEVRVGKLRVIGRVTAGDVKTYDDSYTRISGWAARHDPDPSLIYTPPSVDVLKAEIEVLDDWLKKVKRYQNK